MPAAGDQRLGQPEAAEREHLADHERGPAGDRGLGREHGPPARHGDEGSADQAGGVLRGEHQHAEHRDRQRGVLRVPEEAAD